VGTAQWNTTVQNWTNSTATNTYTVGDAVVFTDNFAGLTSIALSGQMNPSSVEFAHVGSTPVHYYFERTDQITNAGFTGSSSSPWGTSFTAPPTLTLDANFSGTVELTARGSGAAVLGLTTVNGGVLLVDDIGALPPFNNSNNNPAVVLNGGTFGVNINTGGNTAPASTNFAGTMNVISNSNFNLYANNNSAMWAGTINIGTGVTLSMNSVASSANEMGLAGTVVSNGGTISLGSSNSILRLDSTNAGSAGTIYDIGTGAGMIRNKLANGSVVNMGELTGGAGTFLEGSESSATAATTYSIGALGSSTFQGIIRNESVNASTVSITKVGSSTLTLTNGSNSYTGTTTVNNGTLQGTASSGTPFGTGNIAVNGGVLSVSPSGSGSAVTITGASAVAGTSTATIGSQLSYAGGGTLALNKGTQNSLTFLIGNSGDVGGQGTVIVSRSGAGTLVLAPAGGTAATNLGVNEVFVENSTDPLVIPPVNNGIVNSSIVGQNNDVNKSGDFLTYDTVKGFILATYGDTNFAAPSATTTELVNVAQSGLGSESVFALNASANVGLAGGNTLTIGNPGTGAGQSNQAGLILNGATLSGGTAVAFGAAEGTIYTSVANGTISTPVTGTAGMTKFGPGTLTLTGNNAISGTTSILGGTLILTGDNSGNGTGSTVIGQNSTLQLQAAAGGTNNGLSPTATLLTFQNNSTLQLRADSATSFFNSTSTVSPVSMNGNSVTIDVNQLTNAGSNVVLSFDPTTSTTTFAGFTANNATINVTGGNGYSLALPQISEVNNGNTDTINPTTASVTLAGFTAFSTGTGAITGSLALSGTNAGNVVSGPIINGTLGTAALVKSGVGTWRLDGANTYTGGTRLNGGVLALNNSSALGPSGTIIFGGGTLQFSSNNTQDYSARIQIPDTFSAILDTNGQNVTFAGVMTTQGNAKNGSITKLGAGTLTISGAQTITGGATVNAGTLQLSNAAALPATSKITNNAGLDISATTTLGSITGTGTTTVDATDSLTVGNLTQNGGIVNNGTLQVNGNGTVGPISGAGTLIVGNPTATVAVSTTLKLATSSGLSTVGALNIVANGSLDINNNHVIVNYGSNADPISSIVALLNSGFNGGTWNGPTGITSSAVATNPGYSVGYADSADAGNPANLASGTLEVAFTLLGDANLDHTVNGVDFGILAANFNKGITGWDNGDFNYDNAVNGVDFGALAANFNKGASAASGGATAADFAALDAFAAANGLLADVPEPATFGVLAVAGAGLLARRRRRGS
jgi:autotransporter-associated beta strand protein